MNRQYMNRPIATFSILQEGVDAAGEALENSAPKPMGLLKRKPLPQPAQQHGGHGSNAIMNAIFDPFEAMLNSAVSNSKQQNQQGGMNG